ncbi:MAG: hypothetical protein IKP76_01395 [Bacilli bacterium]|nr:hypothetical protein [Bacilli bacterium]
MKNRLYILIIILLLTPIVTFARSASNITLGDSFKGSISVGSGYSPNYSPLTFTYVTHQMSFESEDKSKAGQAFCVYPGLSAQNVNEVYCSPIIPREWPQVYYVTYNYWDTLKNDRDLADFVMRTAGVFDRAHMRNVQNWYFCNGDDGCIKELQKQQEADKQSSTANLENNIVEGAFIASHQVLVQGPPYTMNDGIFRDKNGGSTVQRGVPILKEAWDARSQTENWSIPDYVTSTAQGDMGSAIKGANFTLSPSAVQSNTPKVAYYDITSNDGLNVGDICVKAINGNASVDYWDGVNGRIMVTADANCKSKVRITRGTCSSGSGGTPVTPRPYTCPNNTKKCKKTVPTYKTVQECNGTWRKYNSSCQSSKDSYCPTYCDGELVNNQVESGSKTIYNCIGQNMSCSVGGTGWTEAASNEDKEFDLSSNYATEPNELNFEGYKGEYNDDIENGIVKTVQTTDTRNDLQLYWCEIGGQNAQSYIVVVDGGSRDDDFVLKVNCDNCCDTVEHSSVVDVSNIHNCCEDGVESFAKQAALDELFCTDPTLKVDGFKAKCNTDDYRDGADINTYCKQYCSETIVYKIPPPTRAKADAYFWFAKNNINVDTNEPTLSDSFTGPIFQKYKRCRTLISYDKFNSDYKTIATGINNAYTNYQEKMAYVKLWEKLRDKATDSAATASSDAKTTLSDVGISCSYTIETSYRTWHSKWEGTYSCPTATNPRKTCDCSLTTNPGAHAGCSDNGEWKRDGNGSKSFSKESTVSGDTVRVYNESTEVNNYKFKSYGTNEGDWSPKLINKDNKLNVSRYAYNSSDIDNFKKKVDNAKSDLATETKNAMNDETWCEGDSCIIKKRIFNDECSGSVPAYDTEDPSNRISRLYGEADNAKALYSSYVNQLKDIQIKHDDCGGAFSNGTVNTETIRNRISFNQEPDMTFHYYQEYMDDETKQINGQLIEVPFYPSDINGNKYTGADNKHCIYETKTGASFDDPDWSRWDVTGYQDNHYSKADWDPNDPRKNNINLKFIDMYNYSTDQLTYETLNASFTGSAPRYRADKKYTTDAVKRMTCRWSDDKTTKTYNLIPNGLVVKDYSITTDDIKNLGRSYIGRTGTYTAMKTVRVGRMEVYYTLKNIGDPFEDLIQQAAPSCSDRYDLAIDGEPTNLTCYIEVEDNGWTIYDCPPGCPSECCNTGTKTCGVGGNCTDECSCVVQKQLLEYKEVDAANLFPNKESEQYKDNDGYAWNWYKGPNGQEVMKRITDDAKTDKTYSKNNITYSFTLKPSDIRAIRAYNKAMIKAGGYGSFDMDCGSEANKEYAYGETVKPVSKCKSKFITAISGGDELNYGTGRLKLNTNNMDLLEVRRKWKVYEYDDNGKLKNSGA